jgi:hypothetical protein
MARPRRTQAAQTETKKISKEDLIYLAGVWESSLGLKSPATTNAVAISNDEDWPKYLAKTYGGEAKEFTSNAGKNFWGWFVTNELKLEILSALENGGVLKGTSALKRDTIRAKLDRAVNKDKK